MTEYARDPYRWRSLEDAEDDAWELEYLLKDILDIESELECIGGGPGWKERRAKAYAAAWELCEGGD